MADLKRLFGLREMAVNVPDKDVPGLKRAIAAAVNSKILPPEANSWVGEKPAAEPKKAQAAGKKPGKDGDDPFFSDFKRSMSAGKADQPKGAKAEPKPVDADLEDDWFQGDEDDTYDPKKATRGGEPDVPEIEDDDEFPVFPDSDAFKSQNQPSFSKGTGDEDDPGQLFAAHNYGGGSSWDDVPDWMRDPEKIPAPGDAKRSIHVPRSSHDEPTPSKGKKPKTPPLSPAGRPWSAKDVRGMEDEPKKPGVLSRLFGRKK